MIKIFYAAIALLASSVAQAATLSFNGTNTPPGWIYEPNPSYGGPGIWTGSGVRSITIPGMTSVSGVVIAPAGCGTPTWTVAASVITFTISDLCAVRTITYSTAPALVACNDGVDNDGDGLIDLADPGCASGTDTDEFNAPVTQCNNGIDDDADGLIDAADPGCPTPESNDESDASGFACGNGDDDDGDGLRDLSDPGCTDIFDDDEYNAPMQCQDGVDNDSDGLVDLADPGCIRATDNDEYNEPAPSVDPGHVFNGNQRITIGPVLGSMNWQQNFAISWLMKTTTPGPAITCANDGANYGRVMFDRDRLGRTGSWVVSLAGNTIAFRVDALQDGWPLSNTICATSNVADGEFHSVRVEKIGAEMRIYIDGVQEAESPAPIGDLTCSVVTAGDCDLVVGEEKWNFNTLDYVGYIGSVEFYGDDLEFNSVKYVGGILQ